MRTRDKKLSDYGINKDREKELLLFCRNTENEDIVKEAAGRANPFLKTVLCDNLLNQLSYDKIIKENSDLPCLRNDFYGYRRRTLGILNEMLAG